MPSKPKILRILNRFNVGGPVQNVTLLSRFLNDEYETLLIGGDAEANEESSLYVLDRYQVKPLLIAEMQRSINPLQDIKAYWRIRKIIREFKPDIVHTHASKAGAVGRLAASHEGVKVIVHTFHGHVFHSYFGNLKSNIFQIIERFLAKKSSAIIAISDKLKNELVDEYSIASTDKVKCVPLGFDLDLFTTDNELNRINYRRRWKCNDDEIIVGIVGRIVPVKNHKLLVDAASIIRNKTNKKVRYILVGDGESRPDLENYIAENGFSYIYKVPGNGNEDFILTSWESNTPEVYAGVDIVCLSSFNEGTPVSLIEAQASGKPIVTTKVGGIENVVLPNVSALLTSLESDDFAAALLRLINDDELRNKMQGAGREFSMSKFHYSRLTGDFKKLYKELLNS